MSMTFSCYLWCLNIALVPVGDLDPIPYPIVVSFCDFIVAHGYPSSVLVIYILCLSVSWFLFKLNHVIFEVILWSLRIFLYSILSKSHLVDFLSRLLWGFVDISCPRFVASLCHFFVLNVIVTVLVFNFYSNCGIDIFWWRKGFAWDPVVYICDFLD